MEIRAIDRRREILKDCLASFIVQLCAIAEKKGRPIRRRELVRMLRQTSTDIRERYEGPLLADDVRTTINSMIECMTRAFSRKATMTDFLGDFFGGQPVLDIKTGKTTEFTTCDLITTKQDSFSIWQFILDQEERKQYLTESIKQGMELERTLGKSFAGTFLFDARKTECTFVPFKKELKSVLIKAKSADQGKTNKDHEVSEVACVQRNDRAAVIILDVEGQFGAQIKALQNVVCEICARLKIEHATTVEVFNVPFSATLSLKELNLKDLEYFMSKLTVKSRDQFLVALGNIQKRGLFDSASFFEEIDNEIENNQVIHFSIKKSLCSALLALKRVVSRIFDDDIKTPLVAERLIVPGKISVVDVSALDDEEKRYVAIYLLAILDRQKREFSNPTRTVLIFDEAHKLFPQVPPKSEKDYVERVNAFVSDIVHRGRKRKYSVVVSTQSPGDVSKGISKLCDTDIVFEISGQGSWIRELVSTPETRKRIESLNGVGTACVICKGTPMIEGASKVRFPHIAKLYQKKEVVDVHLSEYNNNNSVNRIGKIVHRQNTPLEISIDQSMVRGHVSSKYAALAHPPQVLVARPDNNHGKRIFCKVVRLESEPWSVRGEEKQVSEFVTYVDLKLLREIDEIDRYAGSPRNQNLEDFGLYLADEEDVKICYNLPQTGFPLGEILLSEVSNQTTLYYYPYNPNNYQRQESEWLVDHSIFIVGNQGRGKTNALFYISMLLSCNDPETTGAAIIKSCSIAH